MKHGRKSSPSTNCVTWMWIRSPLGSSPIWFLDGKIDNPSRAMSYVLYSLYYLSEWDSFNDMTKAREFGFAGFANSLVSFKKTFLAYERRGMIPKIDVLSQHIKERHDQIAAEKQQQDLGVQQPFPSKPVQG